MSFKRAQYNDDLYPVAGDMGWLRDFADVRMRKEGSPFNVKQFFGIDSTEFESWVSRVKQDLETRPMTQQLIDHIHEQLTNVFTTMGTKNPRYLASAILNQATSKDGTLEQYLDKAEQRTPRPTGGDETTQLLDQNATPQNISYETTQESPPLPSGQPAVGAETTQESPPLPSEPESTITAPEDADTEEAPTMVQESPHVLAGEIQKKTQALSGDPSLQILFQTFMSAAIGSKLQPSVPPRRASAGRWMRIAQAATAEQYKEIEDLLNRYVKAIGNPMDPEVKEATSNMLSYVQGKITELEGAAPQAGTVAEEAPPTEAPAEEAPPTEAPAEASSIQDTQRLNTLLKEGLLEFKDTLAGFVSIVSQKLTPTIDALSQNDQRSASVVRQLRNLEAQTKGYFSALDNVVANVEKVTKPAPVPTPAPVPAPAPGVPGIPPPTTSLSDARVITASLKKEALLGKIWNYIKRNTPGTQQNRDKRYEAVQAAVEEANGQLIAAKSMIQNLSEDSKQIGEATHGMVSDLAQRFVALTNGYYAALRAMRRGYGLAFDDGDDNSAGVELSEAASPEIQQVINQNANTGKTQFAAGMPVEQATAQAIQGAISGGVPPMMAAYSVPSAMGVPVPQQLASQADLTLDSVEEYVEKLLAFLRRKAKWSGQQGLGEEIDGIESSIIALVGKLRGQPAQENKPKRTRAPRKAPAEPQAEPATATPEPAAVPTPAPVPAGV